MARILVVDDFRSARDAVVALLVDYDFECVAVGSGEEALARLAAEPFDLVLLDVTMPGMSGLEVLRELRTTRPLSELPVIMVTGRDGGAELVAAFEGGANDYVTKPIDSPVLLARIRTQLALLQLGRAKDEFLRIASHDLKNPLTTILAGSEYLKNEVPAGTVMSPDAAAMVASIHRRALDMRRLIKDFLDLHALRDGHFVLEPAAVDLAALARKVVADDKSYAERKRITLLADAPESIVVRADAARIEQVVQNLVDNALKFSGPDTRVVVRARAAPAGARLEVEDQGPGLTPEDQAKLFLPHVRLGNRPTGGESSSGLGLGICKRMIELHGGRIGADSSPGRGATFWFELPRG